MRKIEYRHRYTLQEIAYLRKHAAQLTMDQLIAGMNDRHSAYSIKKKCELLHISRVAVNDGYTLRDVMIGLGLGSERPIYKWMKLRWIKATRRGPNDTTWNFHDKDIKKFLLKHPEEIKPEVMKSLWVQDILYDGWSYGMGRLA